MRLLEQEDGIFRPLPSREWHVIWDNASETREKITLAIIQSVIKKKWMEPLVDKYRAEEAAEYDASNADNSR